MAKAAQNPNLEKPLRTCINPDERNSVPNQLPNPTPSARPRRGSTILASALLLAALALVVLYTKRPAFLSPLALVVVAAIGLAALLLQFRLQPDAASQHAKPSPRGSLWLTAVGVIFAIGAVFGDLLRLRPWFMLATSLAAVACFAISGIALLNTLRKRQG
ncbi:MAG: hypothetical protein WAK22_07895 [Candidatus Sulfotelmatobacter sp.]